MNRSNNIRPSIRDSDGYTPPVFCVISHGEDADEAFCLSLGKGVQHPLDIQNISSTSEQQREGQKDSSSHLLIKPGDLIVTPCHAETIPSDLQEEWSAVVSQTYDNVPGHRLLKPRDFMNLLEPDANSMVVSSSEENWFSASSHISADTNVPRLVCRIKPCELKITRTSDYSPMSCNPDGSRFRNSSQAITTNSLNRVSLLRPCNFGLSRSQISSSSKTSVGQEISRYQVGLLKPSDISTSIPKNSTSSSDVGHDWFSTFSLIKVTGMSLLRPHDISTSGSGSASSVLPAVFPETIPLARQLHLVRPCDLTKSSSISHEVTTYSSRRSEISPLTSSYFSASSHFLDNQWQLRSFLSLRITPSGICISL